MSAGAGLLGAVLAGGASRRYGGSKAGVTLAGTPLVRRAVEALDEAVDEVVVVSSRPVPAAAPTAVVPDRTTDAGPLGGLHAALHEARERDLEGVLLLACDLPFVAGVVVASLARELRDGAEAVAPVRAGGGIEPLCSAWSLSTLLLVEEALGAPDRSLHRVFRAVGGVAVEPRRLGVRSAHTFLNLNTPADRARAEAILRGGSE